MRTAAKIAIVAITVSILSLMGGWIYHVQSQNELKQRCLKLENDILSLDGKVSSAEMAFDASDFNARCGDIVGPNNQLVISGSQ